MIGWGDVYRVVVAMVPLYVPLFLGYASVKWLRMFNSQQFGTINQMTYNFILPLFIFESTTHLNPFKINYIFVAGDVISKFVVCFLLFGGAYAFDLSYGWCITCFDLFAINNSHIVGVVLMRAVYGSLGEELVIQSTILQLNFWVTVLLFMLEVRRTRRNSGTVAAFELSDVEESNAIQEVDASEVTPSVWVLIKTVLGKVANPICLACVAGLVWAFLANWWHFEMPSIMEGSIKILSKAAIGTYMFCMGLFMALNKKIEEHWNSMPYVAILSRFIMGPFLLGLVCFYLGLHGEALKAAVIQATLPPAYISFIYAKEYQLNIDNISYGVIYGTLLSLPVMLVYFAVVEWLGSYSAGE